MFEIIGNSGKLREKDWRATATSVAAHAGLLALLVAGPGLAEMLMPGTSDRDGFGTGPTDGPAGGGGGGTEEYVTYIDIAPSGSSNEVLKVVAPEEPVEPEPLPVPEPEPEVEEVPPPLPPPVMADEPTSDAPTVIGEAVGMAGAGTTGSGAGVGPGSDGGSGGGSGGGIGSGAGPGTGGGSGDGNIRLPVPKAVFLPPTPPASLRGKTVTLALSVNEKGRVAEARVETPTGDRGFESKLRKSAMDWQFEPGRDASNRAVATWTKVSFRF